MIEYTIPEPEFCENCFCETSDYVECENCMEFVCTHCAHKNRGVCPLCSAEDFEIQDED